MNKKILSVILAAIMVAGTASVIAMADEAEGDTPATPEVTSTIVDESADPAESEPEEPEAPRAQSIIFSSDSGFTAIASSGFVGGVKNGMTAGDVLNALKSRNGIEVIRGEAALADEDVLMSDDMLVLTDVEGNVKSMFYIVIMGNADRNDAIDLGDVTTMLKRIAMWNDVSIDVVAADVDANGAVELADVIMLLKHIAGWNNVAFATNPVLPNGGVIKTCGEAEGSVPNVNLRKGQEFGIKFTVEEGLHAKSSTARYPSWGDNKGSIRLSLYKWDTDYATTIAAEPIATQKYENFNDSVTIEFMFKDADGNYVGAGEYLWLIHEGFDERINPNDETEPVGVGLYAKSYPAASAGLTLFYEGVAMDPADPASYGPDAQINICK